MLKIIQRIVTFCNRYSKLCFRYAAAERKFNVKKRLTFCCLNFIIRLILKHYD